RARIRSQGDFVAQVSAISARLLGAAPRLEPASEERRSRWRVERRGFGRATLGGRTVELQARADGSRALWLAIAVGSDAPRPAAILDQVIGGWLMLTSHACECGYDCDPRSRR